MTITLLTPVQHQLSISLPQWEKNQRIIGYIDPHPASMGRLANAWLATVTCLSKRSGNTRALGWLGNKWPWYCAVCMQVFFRRQKDKGVSYWSYHRRRASGNVAEEGKCRGRWKRSREKERQKDKKKLKMGAEKDGCWEQSMKSELWSGEKKQCRGGRRERNWWQDMGHEQGKTEKSK